MMSDSLRIRSLSEDDLPFADSLRAVAGWNQTPADWLRFLRLEPEGCFVAEWNRSPVGTATTLVHGPELAWIGMVLVLPEHRNRGIGRALLVHAIEHLQRRGIGCIRLDATPLGLPVYQRLGFRREESLVRWEHPAWTPGHATRPTDTLQPRMPTIQPSDLTSEGPLIHLETRAFGIPRLRLLTELVGSSTVTCLRNDRHGKILGYGYLRSGALADYLGPAVAVDDGTTSMIAEALLEHASGHRVFWDIPAASAGATRWAVEHGFRRQRELTRMSLGPTPTAGEPGLQMALSGPETG
ncbi:MAG: GNAT family N-acetyltransferase [Verrucomicrobiales bacterium]|nr:GNAT family N-acetyltransferase [Verrucomicrobiales bacterium]